GIEFVAGIGDTLMGAAQACGLYWPTTCGGQGVCTTCLSEVVGGSECLSEMGRSERKALTSERGEAVLQRPVRLACQATVIANGSITLTKNGVHAGAA
ncbi:MAG TPA: 2Fe-2S iron-sulfur cluster-binding protein, partial [Dehalococcoidia bacterium]|nr:2Fe-2S iron-sulfur cluster-binding protein [Dehalococcoidia bacterium]